MENRFLKKRFYSFKEKLVMAFIIVGILPLLILSIYNLCFIYGSTKDGIEQYTLSNMQTSEALINNSMIGFKNMVEFIANSEEVKNVMIKEQEKISKGEYFDDTQKLYNITTTLAATLPIQMPIHIVDNNKKSRFSTTNYYKPIYEDSRGDFYKIMDMNEDNVAKQIHRRFDQSISKDVVMVMGKSIIDKSTGNHLGYIIIEVLDEYFQNFIENISFFDNTNVYMIDNKGYIVTDNLYKNKTGYELGIKNNNNVQKVNDFKKLYYFSKGSGNIKIVSIIPLKNLFKELYKNIKFSFALTIIVIMLGVVMIIIFSRLISKPIHEMNLMMVEVEEGNRNVQVNYTRNDEIGELCFRFNEMIREINRLIDEDYNKKLLIKQAEFKALKAQVNPHFLYNTLGAINWMAKLGEKEGVIEMTNALSKFFRYSSKNNDDKVLVEEELNQIKNYLTIQSYRYKDKLNVTFDVDKNILNETMLKLMLQPIVENAIVHGLEPKLGEWSLVIRGYIEGSFIVFKVIDNGIGLGNSKKHGEGIGVKNLDERIKIYYGKKFGVKSYIKDGLTVFEIVFPKREGNSSD